MKNDVSKKKTSKEKRVLIAALCIAASVIAGSTFAWFTSQDEVTNRLSASAAYNVTIAEDFTPPEEWVPGQTIKKEVSAINTGNVDAFVRMWLTGDMKLVNEGEGIVYTSFDAAALTAVTAQPYAGLKLTKEDASHNYYRVLNDDERKALQTGELAYAKSTYTYTKNQSDDGLNYGDGTAYTNGQGAVKYVDSESFTPTGVGLYIFRRNYDLVAGTGNADPATAEFSGYYFDGTDYYALKTANDSTVPGGVAAKGKNVYIGELSGKEGDAFDAALATVKVYTAKENTLANSNLTWTYNTPDSAAASPFGTPNPYFTVKPTGGSDTFKINIELDNIGDGTAADKWQPIGTAGATTFYYTDDVEAGETTSKLVKNVQLDKGATQEDFLAFDFDLNVNLESIQVTKGSDGKETVDSVTGSNWAATAGATGATGAATAAADLASVSWTAK
ncbi:BsaA family SipW-dependent biofilm matrix protein [Ruminococcus flavefaciens]|uniref:BsaA family SipW-dependent biofilm matrix protein n=1 Tax=Ruminococcus flavefaciens TaxID=1265 RepID=UPI0026E922EC|nr:BsaA family SipW-dependent biofilm matrix protein [Ruminococcus flavefaciens]